MASYTREYRQEGDGEHLTTRFNLDRYEVSLLGQAIECLIDLGAHRGLLEGVMSAPALIRLTRLEQLFYDAEDDHVEALNKRHQDSEGSFEGFDDED